ncbi:MAG TPA: glycosyltransferase family 4 protein [Vicinamibacterales bacterium]|nr:glycosyltransferase family 4 protein [Vicinamibacterales bacterium]
MHVLLTSEARFERAPDGSVWGQAAYGRDVWARYLDVFPAALVAARVQDVREPSAGCVPASGPGVRFVRIPPFSGLHGLAATLPQISRQLTAVFADPTAVIVRSPSALAAAAARVAGRKGRPFAAEIVGDPREVFSRGAMRHPLRLPIRWLATAAQKRLAQHAAAVLYVTRRVLQTHYPAAGCAFSASDVVLDDAAFCAGARQQEADGTFVLVTVGALDQPYKGTATLLRAVSQLRRAGVLVRLRVVGSGRLLPELLRMTEALGLSPDVEFLGQQDRAGVRVALDAAHLFVLPSLTEGLPRALLEAMARALPAVATQVGGIPELLPAECLVPPRNAQMLATRIAGLIRDPAARQRFAERNLREARTYHERLQSGARREFLAYVREISGGGATREVRCA